MKKTKPVEWKDTRFPFSIEYNYSLFVRNRCVFFYCLAKNVRKMINYAHNFACPSNICVVYVYGAVKSETVQKILNEKRWHILLLIVPEISVEDIKTLTEYDKWLDRLKKQGLLKIIKQGVPKSKYSNVLVGTEYGDEPNELWYNQYNRPEWEYGYKVYTEGIELMEHHSKATESIRNAQCGKLEVLANFPTTDMVDGSLEVHDGELLNIIRKLYPYGVESDTTDEIAVKLLKIKKLVPAALKGEITPDVEKLNIHFADSAEQLCFWDTVTAGASECLEFLKKYCSEMLAKKGCFNYTDMWSEFSRPPYGAYECNWYCYIFALAVRDYNTNDYFYGNATYAAKNSGDISCIDFKYLYGFIFVQNEKQEEFRRLLAKLFDIEEPADTTRLLITQIAMGYVTNNIKWAPLDCIDHRFHEIFVEYGEEYNTPYNYSGHLRAWYEFGYEEKYLPWLKENFDDLYVRIRNLDEKFLKALAEKYGQKLADFYCEWHTIDRGARGWLHTKSDLERSVKNYMESVICRECGRPINIFPGFPEGAHVYEASEPGYNGETINFTLKDIIGINKKLLGRNRSDYLCIPCLAEYTEYSEIELGHLVHDFKEQGCELF